MKKFLFLFFLFVCCFAEVNNGYLWNYPYTGDISSYDGVVFVFSAIPEPYFNLSSVKTNLGNGYNYSEHKLLFNDTAMVNWDFDFGTLTEFNSYDSWNGSNMWLNDSFDMRGNFSIYNSMGRNIDSAFVNVTFIHSGYVNFSGLYKIYDSDENEVSFNETIFNSSDVVFNFIDDFSSGENKTYTLYFYNNSGLGVDSLSVAANFWADGFKDNSLDAYWQVSEEAAGYVEEKGGELEIYSDGVDGYAYANFLPFVNDYFDVVVSSRTSAPANLQDEPLAWSRSTADWGVTAAGLKVDFWTNGAALRIRYKDTLSALHCWDWTVNNWGVGCADHGAIVASTVYYYRIKKYNNAGTDSIKLYVYDSSFVLIEETNPVAVSDLLGTDETGYILMGQPYTDVPSTLIADQFQDEFGFNSLVMNQTHYFAAFENRTMAANFFIVYLNVTDSIQEQFYYDLNFRYEFNNSVLPDSIVNPAIVSVVETDATTVFNITGATGFISSSIPVFVEVEFWDDPANPFSRTQIPGNAFEDLFFFWFNSSSETWGTKTLTVTDITGRFLNSVVYLRKSYAAGFEDIVSHILDASHSAKFDLIEDSLYQLFLIDPEDGTKSLGFWTPGIDSEFTVDVSSIAFSYSESAPEFNITSDGTTISFYYYDSMNYTTLVYEIIYNASGIVYESYAYDSEVSFDFTANPNDTYFVFFDAERIGGNISSNVSFGFVASDSNPGLYDPDLPDNWLIYQQYFAALITILVILIFSRWTIQYGLIAGAATFSFFFLFGWFEGLNGLVFWLVWLIVGFSWFGGGGFQ